MNFKMWFNKKQDVDIEFVSVNKDTTNKFPPLPAKQLIPEWYKNLETNCASDGLATVKACIPVQDIITSGYIIRNDYETDLKLEPDYEKSGTLMSMHKTSAKRGKDHVLGHYHRQCPVDFGGDKAHYFKYNNDWIIRTPPGYSCLIMHPFWHMERRYTFFPGIIDTDTYDKPILLTGVQHTRDIVTIAPGDPLVQVIPFKRDAWKMKTSEDLDRSSLMDMFIDRGPVHSARRLYKKLFHQKKRFD